MIRNPLKWLFYVNVALVVLLLVYKAYLNYFLPEFEGVHTQQVEAIHQAVDGQDRFRFVVAGNINNSVGMFENRIIPDINNSDAQFLISAGNAVSNGGEDKYQAVYGTLGKLDIPYLLTFGENEHSTFGSYRFYEHFGPHYFSIRVADTRLIFLDSTGKTPWRWQIRWLNDLLEEDSSRHRIVFVGHPLFEEEDNLLFDDEDDYLQPASFREALLELFRQHQVDLVFSANIATWSERKVDGTRFITTGGAGGLVLNTDESFYHYVMVTVSEDGIQTELEKIETRQHPLLKHLEGLWFFIYSLFYTGFLNFVLMVSVLTILAIKLYTVVFRGRDYYPNYDLDPTPFLDQPLKVTMFTNNYLPFIGGVPLSIERLRKGLRKLGDEVQVVAPVYPDQPEQEEQVLRVPSLLSMGAHSEFRMANIFLGRIRRGVREFRPDVIHLHHPFWLGSLGLFMARVLNVPAVYTYHTRLEHYAHFVPLPGLLFRNLISHALIKRFAGFCDGVIVPTYSTEEYLRMIGVKTPTYVQPTGIDYQRFREVSDEEVSTLRQRLKLPQDTRIFISVARLSNEKNIDFMIEALTTLRQQSDTPFHFLMIGDGHQRARLQERVTELGMDDCITLVGAVPPDDMATWYRLGDAFLFASKSETQGMVILEAMAAGLPVVAVRSSGIDDVIQQDVNGYKTPERQDLWSERVRQLLENDDLRQRLSGNALAFARDYSVENFAANVREIYATLLATRREQGRQRRFGRSSDS
ncbi:glycosyltransferase [Marinobacter lacisalsi]|uniref:Glycosyltransferase n=1 Tax=Marinobacter lacisalsi TaxID=475979 RepID=A0ABV8QKT6_9GAMM